MPNKLKIATIGGASSYTPEIIEGFINRYDKLPVDELWLVDIEPSKERLEIVGNLSKRMIEKAGLKDKFKIFTTLDRREAIKDASFVTTQLRVGLLDARIRDERIPLSYGMIGQETNGAGGFAKALRTIPVIFDICNDIKELAPNAYLINFTNPSGIVTEAVLKYHPEIKIIGLCNVPVNMKKSVAEILKVSDDEITFIAGGVNHFLWGREVIHKGVDRTQEVLEKYLNGFENGPANINTEIAWIKEQVLDTKMIPCPYHRYYYLTDEMLREELAEFRDGKGTRGEQVKAIEKKLFEIYKNPNLNTKPEELNNRGGKYYSDSACELISSLYNNTGKEMIISTRNNGTIDCLPNDCAVEITVNVYRDELKPLKQQPFPIEVRGLLQLMKNFEQLTVEAAVHGDYSKALQALTVNPLVVSGKVAKTILDEIIKQNKDYLPQFYKNK
ncbi:6-phospho-beta-glucosidase [uncultured Brachyspira sp.]|uniref:6-phospho-beta-glucosidase n=1 Tax=uncultured Brachyspira sp. TaxID=221953 RepID=UPI0026365682|nr:6-phospho-beta-glucosidase [uncultured Brachyspira sp.]